jgi:hypothetical protein
MKKDDRGASAAWKVLLAGVAALGWKVTRRADREAIYRTPVGRVGTLTLKPYGNPHRGAWRWTVDRYDVRYPGKLVMASPQLPAGRVERNSELSCALAELDALAKWLPVWLAAYDAGKPLPAMPVDVPERDHSLPNPHAANTWNGGYTWTALGSLIQSG